MANHSGNFRETAALDIPRETAEARTFSEEEHTAIVADRIARETADLTAERDQLVQKVSTLETENTELRTKLDAAEVAKEAAATELANYKAEVAETAAREQRSEERAAKVREAAKHMPETWFTPERASHWAGMEQAAFDTYVSELAEVSGGVSGATGDANRETAAKGTPPAPDKKDSASFWTAVKGGTR